MKHSRRPIDFNRRKTLRWVAVTLAVPAALSVGLPLRERAGPDPTGSLKANLGSIFRDRAAASETGRAYLAAHPEERVLETLVRDLEALNRPHDADGLKQTISDLRQRDFAREDLAIVNGWVLARCEARACALVYLL